jgi:hypothetical protein
MNESLAGWNGRRGRSEFGDPGVSNEKGSDALTLEKPTLHHPKYLFVSIRDTLRLSFRAIRRTGPKSE